MAPLGMARAYGTIWGQHACILRIINGGGIHTRTVKGEKGPGKGRSGRAFLKKRAPIYLALAALFVVFAIPELTSDSLHNHIPDGLEGGQKAALDTFLAYRGPNNMGMNAVDALAERMSDDYPDGNILDEDDTAVEFTVDGNGDAYRISISIETERESTIYEWDVDIATGVIKAVSPAAKNILNVVDYSR